MVHFSPEHDFVLPLAVRTMPGVWFLFLPLFLLIMVNGIGGGVGGVGGESQEGAGVLLFIVFVTATIWTIQWLQLDTITMQSR